MTAPSARPDRLRRLAAHKPVLLIWGMKDRGFGHRRIVDRWRRSFPDAEVVIPPDASHAAEHASAFEELVSLLRASEEWTYVEREIDFRAWR